MEVLKCLRRGKAPGPDGILNEMMMYSGGRLVEVMLLVMDLILRSESCPADWKRSLLVPLHKDGDNDELGNCRGIAFRLLRGKGIFDSDGGRWDGLLRIGRKHRED